MKQLLDPTVAPDKLFLITGCTEHSIRHVVVLLLANPLGLLVQSSTGIIETVFVIILLGILTVQCRKSYQSSESRLRLSNAALETPPLSRDRLLVDYSLDNASQLPEHYD
jgi:hypothetical protein